jgi:streptothricin hydrolase
VPLAGRYERVIGTAPASACGTDAVDDIPAAVVARVAEHALGDEPELVASTTDVVFGE